MPGRWLSPHRYGGGEHHVDRSNAFSLIGRTSAQLPSRARVDHSLKGTWN